MIGPPASMTGGIAGVAAQLHRIDYGPDVRTAFFATTHAPRTSESLPARALRHARHLAALRRTIAAVAPDIVHIHTCSGFSFYRAAADAQLARRARCRVILHVHGAAFDVFYARAGRTARWIIDKTLSAADSVIALSLGWQQKLHAIAPAARITVVANAVDLPPAPAKTSTDGPCRFLLLARMDTWKGVDDL
ncbi:MAG: glycosyltransferase, partial [Phycisphaerae bacterium]